jgi:hypothetical protein
LFWFIFFCHGSLRLISLHYPRALQIRQTILAPV